MPPPSSNASSPPVSTWPELRGQIERLGMHLSPQIIEENFRILASLHGETLPTVRVTRDIHYGEHERHVLNVFAPMEANSRPVLIFVHGGGFVSGDKAITGTPFHDNVGIWAARNAIVGVTINYRLAPQHRWPSGAEDAGAALDWVTRHIKDHGGDPTQIFIMGHSAGAAHVGQLLSQRGAFTGTTARPAGAILISGLYDMHTAEKNPLFMAYFGESPAAWAEQSALSGISSSPVPLMVAVAEYDPPDFQQQWLTLIAVLLKRDGRLPHIAQLHRHGHLSTVMTLNSRGDDVEAPILNFIESLSSGRIT